MNKIDFEKYPKVYKYVKHLLDNQFFKPFEHNPLDEETYIKIVSAWIDEYERNIDVMVRNTLAIYDLTNEETGYKALTQDWLRWREQLSKRPKRITEELVRQWWEDKLISCISHLYTSI